MERLILRCGLAPGDIVMLTAAVRDLHRCYPGRFQTDVRTFSPDLWQHNPFITRINDRGPGALEIDCSYPLINSANRLPHHCLHGFIHFLNQRLGLCIALTEIRGDIHLAQQEKLWFSQVHELTGSDTPFWIIDAGGKYDVTTKWWDAQRYQEVVNNFAGRIQFVQVGRNGHHHPKLEGVIDLRGQTDLRQLIRLVYHAQGILCPVTALMHLAAAVPLKHPRRGPRACVVVAGGREPAHWEAYPGHQFIHLNGSLDCCRHGGCWKDRAIKLRDSDERDQKQHLCHQLVGSLPRCMDLIRVEDVVRRIELYFEGGKYSYLSHKQRKRAAQAIAVTRGNDFDNQPLNLHNAGMALDKFVSTLGQYPGGFSGRGIVLCAGGVRYFTNAWVCIRVLRSLGCELPIQVWHKGRSELSAEMCKFLAPFNVQCVDAFQVRRAHPVRLLHGWGLKAYAILHSPFREVLLLDADNVPVRNPEFLFDSSEFQHYGAVFWPDYPASRRGKTAKIWRSCGLRQPKEPEFETGQIVVDKQRGWRALQLSMWFNEHCDFYYRYVHGDKETFHLAFQKLRQPYHLVRTPIQRLEATMCQHDFEGNRLFQHRNGAKWNYLGQNRRIADFRLESQCRKLIAELRSKWDGTVNGRSAAPLHKQKKP